MNEHPKLFGLDFSLAIAVLLFLAMLLTHLSYPLIWEDEGDSVMFGQRVYRYGYPKVHDERNTLYGLKARLEIGVDERTDAYTGGPWVNYYVGAIGVALATRVDDIYEKTLRLRLPYTLIGIAALALFFYAIAPGLRGPPGTKRRVALIYLLMLSVSISLILHMREARYYPIVLLLYGVLLHHFIHHHFYKRIGRARYLASSFLSLFLLFNTFYPAFGVWCVGTCVYLGLQALRREGSLMDRGLFVLRENAPVFLATATVLPLLFYFDFVSEAGRWSDQVDSTLAAYFENLRVVLYNMLRFEFLAPALLLKLLNGARRPAKVDGGWPEHLRPQVETSRFLAVLIICYWLVVSRSPFIFERYFLTMGPLITIMTLMDGYLLARLVAEEKGRGARTSHLALAAGFAAISICLLLYVRLPEIEGRLYEMRHQYKGPADYFIPYILEQYEHPEDLVVATNYAEPVLMYYLGSHVTIGYYGPDLERDMEIQPDIIVPRPWGENFDALRTLSKRVPYAVKTFEVKNQMTNNIPALSPHTPGGLHHRFETVLAKTPKERTRILERKNEKQAP